MMPFHDFLSRAGKMFRETARTEWWPFPELEKSHIFVIGDDIEFNNSVREIGQDLYAEMSERVPMPFSDVSIAYTITRTSPPSLPLELKEILQEHVESHTVPGSGIWGLDRVMEVDRTHPYIERFFSKFGIPKHVSEERCNQWFIATKILETSPVDMALALVLGYQFCDDHGNVGALTIRGDQLLTVIYKELFVTLTQIAAISHPANYIVRVSPILTDRERRRVEGGAPRPIEKKEHFVVVDHDILVRMRKSPQDTHASPVPHDRRGHWRRLAERCRQARLLGKQKVFVRPTFVGDPSWTDHKHHYEVLHDFRKYGTSPQEA